MALLLARVRSALRSLGNDGAVINVRTHLAAAAEARAAVDQLEWRLAAAERAQAQRAAADLEPSAPHAA
jgi:hypothetical protein